MKIKVIIEWVSGGMMIILLFLGVVFNMFVSGIVDFFGGFMGVLIIGMLLILGVFIFCVGVIIDFCFLGYIVRKGIILLLGKVGFVVLFGVIVV